MHDTSEKPTSFDVFHRSVPAQRKDVSSSFRPQPKSMTQWLDPRKGSWHPSCTKGLTNAGDTRFCPSAPIPRYLPGLRRLTTAMADQERHDKHLIDGERRWFSMTCTSCHHQLEATRMLDSWQPPTTSFIVLFLPGMRQAGNDQGTVWPDQLHTVPHSRG
ncbi:hypothetical protein BU26DRAFT_260472 [Trematosphaeria pertusa]|uniref:Uncharacterized protein n=1 Tax=Trematosphaeria pertusa TaxID=390896 RepID=A0A6A6IS49_9PLEO|nr:uncharacterized protein BU26DRAFT_260472 [Trematosphaeria pertusa]KAF2252642.1 hypothetical protein BU26DRAFT_260472 [Trematosphaeria pertusa]